MSNSIELRKELPPHFLTREGTNLYAILTTIQGSLDRLTNNVGAAIDQQFISTASGRYLLLAGSSNGFVLPPNSGLDLESYRKILPIMIADPKQIRETSERLVTAFYGRERTAPGLSSAVPGPYSVEVGDDLIIETQSERTVITLTADQLANFSNVSAGELAAIINAAQVDFTADTVRDRVTGLDHLRIISKTLGSGATIRVAGGTLQNILKFPMVVPIVHEAGTTFDLTRSVVQNDLLTFTWDGGSTNPELWRAKAGDVLTLRGLVDGVDQLSLLNGSHVLVDVGFDYFVIRDDIFDFVTGTLVVTDPVELAITDQRVLTIFDQPEWALVSEIQNSAVDITVPAVPPITRRSLKGSAHLHGLVDPVITFTRNSIKVQVPVGTDRINAGAQFKLRNDYHSFDVGRPYRTLTVDSNLTQPTYVVMSTDDDAVLPYTVATAMGGEPIQGQIGSDEYIVTFPFRHGLLFGWGFTLAAATGAGNVLAGDLNREHTVASVVNETQVKIRLSDSNGDPIVFSGIPWGPADVYRFAANQLDGSDFYLLFPSSAAAIASGLAPGQTFRLNTSGGVDVSPVLAGLLRFRNLIVRQVIGSQVTFSAGLGVGPEGAIITAVSGARSGTFGGAAVTEFTDLTTDHNERAILQGLQMISVTSQISSNPEFKGSFLYDPTGASDNAVTVTHFVVNLTDDVLEGDNPPALLVDSIQVDGEPFPQNGYLVVDYGTSRQEGPIRYFAVLQNGPVAQILIDPAYRFKKDHEIGGQVQYVSQNRTYTPTTDGSDYPVYVTGTSAARDTMFTLLEQLVAEGIFINRDILFPELRYQDPAIAPFV